jgi:rhamnopyranosyl-N-acetylglucosaminyl-diphospho-decaprenol beta-1,3/1,4-galactofuranosyltransferase
MSLDARPTEAPRVVAVVLTFDQPRRFVACLKAILTQVIPPATVLVVDNASTTSAQDVLRDVGISDPRIEVLRLPENVGPAGGYAEGLRRFLQSKHDVAWLLDDDRIPDPWCLARLIETYGSLEEPAILFPTDKTPQGEATNYPSWCGVLLPRRVVEEVGVPREDFFWWVEDTEYLQWRIPRAGFDVVRVPEATVVHDHADEPKKPAWKYYYEVRNSVYYRRYVQGGTRRRRLRAGLARTLIRILFLERHRGAKLRAFVRGYRDGVAGRLGRTVPVPSRVVAPPPTAAGDDASVLGVGER